MPNSKGELAEKSTHDKEGRMGCKTRCNCSSNSDSVCESLIELMLETPTGVFRGHPTTLHDGRCVAYGEVDFGAHGIVLLMQTPEGCIDKSFGTAGLAFTQLPVGSIQLLTEQDDGCLLMGGGIADQLLVARYLPDGQPDVRFGLRGCIAFYLTSALSLNLEKLVIQADDSIVLLGKAFVANKGYQTLKFQLHSNGAPDWAFNSGRPLLWGGWTSNDPRSEGETGDLQ